MGYFILLSLNLFEGVRKPTKNLCDNNRFPAEIRIGYLLSVARPVTAVLAGLARNVCVYLNRCCDSLRSCLRNEWPGFDFR
jgi:hypothetical protein